MFYNLSSNQMGGGEAEGWRRQGDLQRLVIVEHVNQQIIEHNEGRRLVLAKLSHPFH